MKFFPYLTNQSIDYLKAKMNKKKIDKTTK